MSNSVLGSTKRLLLDHAGPLYRVLLIPVRLSEGMRPVAAQLGRVLRWTFASREDTNYTYELSELNVLYMAHLVAVATGVSPDRCAGFMQEALDDRALREHIVAKTRGSPSRWHSDPVPRFARRLVWYAIVRAMQPRVVVETGVDKGLGSVLLCSALLRNAAEGRPGIYRGTDINPRAGWLLDGRYASAGKILYGDSIESLRALEGPIDVFINDSDHSTEYEAAEYETVRGKLSERAILIGDNAHVSPALCRFSESAGRRFLFLGEAPLDHWYPGAGVGVSLPAERSAAP